MKVNLFETSLVASFLRLLNVRIIVIIQMFILQKWSLTKTEKVEWIIKMVMCLCLNGHLKDNNNDPLIHSKGKR